MEKSELLRLLHIRAPNIMFFLGAGASAAAGIKTAFHMIWDFKRLLFCSSQQVSVRSCADLGDPLLRSRIQRFFDGKDGYPPEDSNEEYAFYFEEAYRDIADRRRYIDDLVREAKPSYGHLALASLLALDKARVVWTTNFDRTVEDAAAQLFGSVGKLVVAGLDAPDTALDALNSGRWPLLVKLHGDFQSLRLKNTEPELKEQDAILRRTLVEACRRYGMMIIGYSGRDDSVMDAFEEAIGDGCGFPSGLYWCHRSEDQPLPRVKQLITNASNAGIDAHFVEIDTFDELFADITSLIPNIPNDIMQHLDKFPRLVSDAPIPAPGENWPVIRLNALPVISAPTICRKIVCNIGGTAEVREAIKRTSSNIIAGRCRAAVIAFGNDCEIRQAFNDYNITEYDLYSIENSRLAYDSAELGLLYDSLSLAFTREHPLLAKWGKGSHLITIDPSRNKEQCFNPLKAVTKTISGTVPNTSLEWVEAIRIRLEYRLNMLWLILEPTVWTEKSDDKEAMDHAKEFVRSRLASRYNKSWNSLIDAWINVIFGSEKEITLSAFGPETEVNAAFTLLSVTAFSRRGNV